MYRKLLIIITSLLLISLGWWGSDTYKSYLNKDLSLGSWNKPKPLLKYNIDSLSKTEVKPVKIGVDGNIFSFEFDPTLEYKDESKIKKVTGLINLPKTEQQAPIVLLIRGYVDPSIYTTGTGTRRVGEYFASQGYITIAPDFLGYAGSSKESGNIFETRFQTYTTVLTLLASITTENFPNWDGKSIFIWAHSNGGQIALTTLAITKNDYPTVLWAPVTEPFPYSILYYTNESEDKGKFIRRELSKFEANYDVNEFSFTNYLSAINAPIELHLGTNDDAIPLEWGDRFVKNMKALNKEVAYYKHSGADHNMNPLWSVVIAESYNFFESQRSK